MRITELLFSLKRVSDCRLRCAYVPPWRVARQGGFSRSADGVPAVLAAVAAVGDHGCDFRAVETDVAQNAIVEAAQLVDLAALTPQFPPVAQILLGCVGSRHEERGESIAGDGERCVRLVRRRVMCGHCLFPVQV